MELKGFKLTKKGWLLIAAAVLIILCTAWLGARALRRRHEEAVIFRNAIIACDYVGSSPTSIGEIKRIAVKEGQHIKKGDILYMLDDTRLNQERKQAEALLATVKSELERATDGARTQEITAVQTQVIQAEAQRDARIAERDSAKSAMESVARAYNMLLDQMNNAINPKTRDHDEDYAIKQLNLAYTKGAINDTQFTVQTETLREQFRFKAQLEERLASLRGMIKSMNAAIKGAEAAVQSAGSRLELVVDGASNREMTILVNKTKAATIALDIAKERTKGALVRATRDGVIAGIVSQPGETAVPGEPVLYIADMNKPYVLALLDERKLKEIKFGQHVEIHPEADVDASLKGVVYEIGNMTADYSPKAYQGNLKGTKGHGVPVKISLIDADRNLIPGMRVSINLK